MEQYATESIGNFGAGLSNTLTMLCGTKKTHRDHCPVDMQRWNPMMKPAALRPSCSFKERLRPLDAQEALTKIQQLAAESWSSKGIGECHIRLCVAEH